MSLVKFELNVGSDNITNKRVGFPFLFLLAKEKDIVVKALP